MKRLPVAFTIFWCAVLTVAALCAWDFFHVKGIEAGKNRIPEPALAQPLALDGGAAASFDAARPDKINSVKNSKKALVYKSR